MKFLFRADASVEIGSGHVMRCLTLADILKARGAECHFVCRQHTGNLIEQICNKGHIVHALPIGAAGDLREQDDELHQPAHAHWLGCSWQEDAQQTMDIVRKIAPDWVVVDHYALDARWEQEVLPRGAKLMAIDDLADRSHVADVLLDQNLGRSSRDYDGLVPKKCKRLIGPRYALLRPEFRALREKSLSRRNKNPRLKHILISMGGVDKDNVTGQILDTLKRIALPKNIQITVIMGSKAPWLNSVRAKSQILPWAVEVLSGVTDMAKIMMQADLAIGAAGSTSWERCCLGLPSVIVILAENQRLIGEALTLSGCAVKTESARLTEDLQTIFKRLEKHGDLLWKMAKQAASVCDGSGVRKVVGILSEGKDL